MCLIVICLILVLFCFVFNMNRKRKLHPECNSNFSDQVTIVGDQIKQGSRQNKNKGANPNVVPFADISHKQSSGANNWKAFLQSQPQSEKIVKNRSKNVTYKHGPRVLSNATIPGTNTINLSNPEDKPSSMMKSNFKSKTNIKFKSGPADNTEQQNQSTIIRNIVSPMVSNKNPVLTKQVAMDCEMVGVEVGVDGSMLARVSLVNAHGECIYDKYVSPTEPIKDYRTQFSGIRPKDLVNATDFKIVQKEVAELLKGKILVGHALKNDLSVLYLTHPRYAIRDTSKFNKFRSGRTPALKKLAKEFLGVTIQDGEHSSIQDALAAMQLYKMFKKEWEASRGKGRGRTNNANLKKGSNSSHATNHNEVDV